MKVILVSPLPPPASGIATWTKMYQAYCENCDVDPIVVNTALVGNRTDTFTARFSIKDEFIRTIKIIRSFGSACFHASDAIIHINSSCSPFGILRDYLCMLIAGRKRDIVLHCHCNVEDQLRGSRLGHIIFGLAAKRAAHIFVLNQSSKRYIDDRWAIGSEIIPNFVQDELIVSDKHIEHERIQRVCFTGHVLPEKGIDEILAAADECSNIQFDIFGIISEKYREMPFPKNVHMHGSVEHDDVLKALDDTDVFLFPSYSEGFSMSLLEAMARGVPVIATDVGANRDMLENEGGIIIPTKDSGAIINAIKHLEDINIRRRMSEWNVHKVRDKYSVMNVMNSIKKMYAS